MSEDTSGCLKWFGYLGAIFNLIYKYTGGSIEKGSISDTPIPLVTLILIGVISHIFNRNSKKESKALEEEIAWRNSSVAGDFRKGNNIKSYKNLTVNYSNKLFSFSDLSNRYFRFSDLESFKIYVDNETIINGVRGASLNVGFGLSVGGTSTTKVRDEVKEISLVFYIEGGNNPGRYSVRIPGKYFGKSTSSDEYRIALETAERYSRELQNIMDYNK